jgi:hypothetical protein
MHLPSKTVAGRGKVWPRGGKPSEVPGSDSPIMGMPPDVLLDGIFPYLSVEDVLRLRRVCFISH